jgi:aminopeptidase-like protein
MMTDHIGHKTQRLIAEWKPHLFALPEPPDWIPYRTSCCAERWGFCFRRRIGVTRQTKSHTKRTA